MEAKLFITPPPVSGPAHEGDRSPSARERLRRASEDLHPESTWRGAVLTAIRAVDEDCPRGIRPLYWLHDALGVLLPDDSRNDSVEQRVLRKAAGAIEDELVADHVSSLRVA